MILGINMTNMTPATWSHIIWVNPLLIPGPVPVLGQMSLFSYYIMLDIFLIEGVVGNSTLGGLSIVKMTSL